MCNFAWFQHKQAFENDEFATYMYTEFSLVSSVMHTNKHAVEITSDVHVNQTDYYSCM